MEGQPFMNVVLNLGITLRQGSRSSTPAAHQGLHPSRSPGTSLKPPLLPPAFSPGLSKRGSSQESKEEENVPLLHLSLLPMVWIGSKRLSKQMDQNIGNGGGRSHEPISLDRLLILEPNALLPLPFCRSSRARVPAHCWVLLRTAV